MEIYLIRHGQSEANAQTSNEHDVGLTALGIRQIESSISFLRDKPLEVVYCSPLKRALESASILYDGLAVETRVHPLFSELGMGCGTKDRTRTELEESYPYLDFDYTINEHGWSTVVHESLFDGYGRAVEAASYLVERHYFVDASSFVLVVTHGYFGSQLVAALLEIPFVAGSFFDHNNSGISRIDIYEERTIATAEERRILRFLNKTQHISHGELT